MEYLDVTGKIVSNGIEELSDKMEKDITPIDKALEKVKAMNGFITIEKRGFS